MLSVDLDNLGSLEALLGEIASLHAEVGKGNFGFDEAFILSILRERAESSAAGTGAGQASANEGGLTAYELKERIAVNGPKMSRCLSKLTTLGLIEETVDPVDRRRCRFTLGSRGENTLFVLDRSFGRDRLERVRDNAVALRRASTKADGSLGLVTASGARSLLLLLGATTQPLPQHEVVVRSHLSQPRVSQALRFLVEKGLVERISPDLAGGARDRRVVRYRLSSRGALWTNLLKESL